MRNQPTDRSYDAYNNSVLVIETSVFLDACNNMLYDAEHPTRYRCPHCSQMIEWGSGHDCWPAQSEKRNDVDRSNSETC